jgi:hypothetical protein
MAASGARRTSLYGLSFELPPDWVDWTGYEFTSDATLHSLCFASERVAPEKLEPWLLGRARALSEAPGARVGRIHRFPNVELRIRGFDAEFEGSEKKLSFAAIARPNGIFTVLAKGRADFVDELKFILGNVTSAPATAATGRHYPVFGLRFHSRVSFRTPEKFLFASSDDSMQLVSEWCQKQPSFSAPNYRSSFTVPREARIDEKQRTEAQVPGRSNPAARRTAPLFDELRCSAFAVSGNERVELLYAEGRAQLDARYLRLAFKGQGSIPRAFGAWQGILSSMMEEG